jgi:transcription elongation factor SPT5
MVAIDQLAALEVAAARWGRWSSSPMTSRSRVSFLVSTIQVPSHPPLFPSSPPHCLSGIWRIKVNPGSEKQLVRSILWKTMSRQREGKPVLVKSVFCTPTAGYIYIEAIEEPLAREAIAGLSGIYYSTLKRVPLAEMTTLLTFTVRTKPVKEGQWCRMRRGPLKGDLVKIVRLVEGEDGGTRALIQAIPRPDYENANKGKAANTTSRPLQRMFVPEDAKAKNQLVERRRGFEGEWYDCWNNDLYKRGFLFKEVSTLPPPLPLCRSPSVGVQVKVETYLNTADAAPKIHELTMFREKSKQEDGGDSDDDDRSVTNSNGKQTSFMVELARQLDIDESTKTGADKVVPFRTGDVVQVTDGEFRNLRGTVLSINEAAQQVTLRPIHTEDLGNITVETALLVKYIRPGAHIKVVNGTHLGQTGRVVSIHKVDGDLIAAILADGTNTEFSANVSHLQVSNEITAGLNSLGGYELYDLVMLSANEYAVVVFVGTEFLKVLTQQDLEKNVRPVEVKGKKSAMRGASGAFDHMKNPLCVGDSVSVVEGVHAKKTGTVRHINRSVLWLHSTTYLKNSGVFVVKGKSCLLAGGQIKDASSATTAAVINATYGGLSGAPQATRGGGPGGGGGAGAFSKRGSKDPMVGKSVTITRGSYKGMLAHVADATETHYSVTLHGRLKTVNVEKGHTMVVGDKEGALDQEGNRHHSQVGIEAFMGGGVPSTPAITAQTPLHLAETPMYMAGNETPLHVSVSTPSRPDTPGRDGDSYGYDVWKPNAADSLPPPSAQSNSSGWGGSDWRSPVSQQEPQGWGQPPPAAEPSGWGQEPTGWGNQHAATPATPEPSGWGQQTEPAGWGKQTEPAGWGRQSEPAPAAGGWGQQTEPSGWGKQTEPTGWGSGPSPAAAPDPVGWGQIPLSGGSGSGGGQPPRGSYYESPAPSRGSSSASPGGAGEVASWAGPNYEWEPGMVVCFTSTRFIGQEGVLESRLSQDGTFNVRVRDEAGSRMPNVSSTQLRLVEPKKRSFVKVMSGSKRGLVGKVKVFLLLLLSVSLTHHSSLSDAGGERRGGGGGGGSGGYPVLPLLAGGAGGRGLWRRGRRRWLWLRPQVERSVGEGVVGQL